MMESLVKIGDKIKFKDCEETSIVKNKFKSLANWEKYNINGIENAYFNALNTCYIYGECILEYEVINIEFYNNNYIYYLGKDNYPLITVDFGDGKLLYPTIFGNELMRKILDLYNFPNY